jgi:outer membrane murein-binding lipoprotein Lpp
MNKLLFVAGVVAVFSLSGCQMNNVRDTGGGAVAPVFSV